VLLLREANKAMMMIHSTHRLSFQRNMLLRRDPHEDGEFNLASGIES